MKVVINRARGPFCASRELITKYLLLREDTFGVSNGDFIEYKFIRLTNFSVFYNPEIDWFHLCSNTDSKEFRTYDQLVRGVEALGEKANRFGSKLVVVDIPFNDFDDWNIIKIDDVEWIEETYKKWEFKEEKE